MIRKTVLSTGILLLFLLMMNGCKNNKRQTILGSICDTTDTKFSTVINPIIITNCNNQNGCHGSSPGSVSLEGYDNVKSHYITILEQIKSGTMPKGASQLDLCTITKIQTWVNRGAQNN